MPVDTIKIQIIKWFEIMHKIQINIIYKTCFKVFIVTGGSKYSDETNTTEIYVEGDSRWTVLPSAELSKPYEDIKMVNVDNEILLIGKRFIKNCD